MKSIEEPNKINAYLKELNTKASINKINNTEPKKTPAIENTYQTRFKTRKFLQENRSASEMRRKFESLEVTPNRWNMTPTFEVNTTKSKNNIKLPKLESLQSQENDLITDTDKKGIFFNKQQEKPLTLDTSNSTKKKRLQPLKHNKIVHYFATKAGSTGKQTKTNQDAIIIETKLPHSLKLYCVCDGHGVNGHLVSNFIKIHLVKNLNKLLKKSLEQPENIVPIIENALATTNQELLDCEINTDLSGSTLVAVFIYRNKLYCFNVGDSRAILISHIDNQWKCKPLSDDQKPSRPDEKERIIKNGGRIQAQKDANGNDLGPLRVWMSNIQMPGLAMTRSFGDKAGVRAGTNAIPQVLEHQIVANDKFLVIASDGVWEYIENEEVMDLLVPFYTKGTLELGCERIISHSTAVWRKYCLSRDDISLIAVSLNDL